MEKYYKGKKENHKQKAITSTDTEKHLTKFNTFS